MTDTNTAYLTTVQEKTCRESTDLEVEEVVWLAYPFLGAGQGGCRGW